MRILIEVGIFLIIVGVITWIVKQIELQYNKNKNKNKTIK